MRSKQPDVWTAGRGDYTRVVTVTYEGTAKVYRPAEQGGVSYESLECGHKHTDPEKAITCGESVARRTARLRNATANPAAKATPCAYGTRFLDFGPDDHQWLKQCTSHWTTATQLATSEADAAADEWTCPWQPFAGTAEGSETR